MSARLTTGITAVQRDALERLAMGFHVDARFQAAQGLHRHGFLRHWNGISGYLHPNQITDAGRARLEVKRGRQAGWRERAAVKVSA